MPPQLCVGVTSSPTSFDFLESLNYLVYESGGRVLLDLFDLNSEGEADVLTREAIETNVSNISTNGTPTPFGLSWLAAYGESQVTFYEPLNVPAERMTFDIDQPCAMVTEPGFTRGNVFIGSRGGKSVLAQFTLDEMSEPTGLIELAIFGAGAALCEIQIVSYALNDKQALRITHGRLLAFDQNTNQIKNYQLVRNDQNRIIDVIEIETVALDLVLAAGETAHFVASNKTGLQRENGMALVFSDGETEGVHRLVIVGAKADGFVVQETYRWNYGTPTAIKNIAIDDYGGRTLFITTSDSPYGVIFKSGEYFPSDVNFLPLSGPAYFDLGVGHDQIGFLSGHRPLKTGFIATFPDENLIKVIEKE